MRPEQFAAATEISPGIAWGGSSGHKTANDNKRTRKKLLWVDDSSALLSLYQAVFDNLGFEVVTTSCAGEALDHAANFDADLVILDYDMPEMNGAQLAAILKDRNPLLPVVLYSGSDSITADAYHWVDAICAKAAPREELLSTIERLLSSTARRKPCRSPLQLIESGIAVPPSSSARASNHRAPDF